MNLPSQQDIKQNFNTELMIENKMLAYMFVELMIKISTEFKSDTQITFGQHCINL